MKQESEVKSRLRNATFPPPNSYLPLLSGGGPSLASRACRTLPQSLPVPGGRLLASEADPVARIECERLARGQRPLEYMGLALRVRLDPLRDLARLEHSHLDGKRMPVEHVGPEAAMAGV